MYGRALYLFDRFCSDSIDGFLPLSRLLSNFNLISKKAFKWLQTCACWYFLPAPWITLTQNNRYIAMPVHLNYITDDTVLHKCGPMQTIATSNRFISASKICYLQVTMEFTLYEYLEIGSNHPSLYYDRVCTLKKICSRANKQIGKTKKTFIFYPYDSFLGAH